MSIEAKIKHMSARNIELLNILTQTDNSVPDLEAQKNHVADLEKQVAQAAEKLKQIGYRRNQELREHESYRDSVLRRLVAKIGGKTDKFEARAAKEEREYLAILQEEDQASAMKKNLDELLSGAGEGRGATEGEIGTAKGTRGCVSEDQRPSSNFASISGRSHS